MGGTIMREKIMTEVVDMIREEIFEDISTVITEDTTREDIEPWDSFEHINILTMIEEKFDISFEATKVGEYDTVGKIVDYIIGEKLKNEK